MASLSSVFKAYDIRGVVPDELNADQFRAIGMAVARFTGAPTILVARDMRESGVELSARSFSEGARSVGVTVIDLGLASTDLLYFAAGRLDAPGAMFTASHNPARYNGIKLCLSGARPIGRGTGLEEIQATAESLLDEWGIDGPPAVDPAALAPLEERSVLEAYATHVRSFVDVGAAPAAGGGRHRQRHGWSGGAQGLRGAALRGGDPLPRVGRQLPQPSGRSHPAGEPGRPEGGRARCGRRRRPGLRRRCRPGLPGRRVVRDGIGLVDHRAGCGVHAGQVPGLDRALQLHLLTGGARGHRREGRCRHPHQGRAQLHQAGHGRDGCRLRWRALRALLLPGQLPGRLGHHRRPARPRAAERDRQAVVGAARPVQALRRLGRDQHRGRRPGGHGRAAGRRGGGRRGCPGQGGPARRTDRRPGRLVVQPPSVEHRATAPSQRRGSRRGRPAQHVAEVQADIDRLLEPDGGSPQRRRRPHHPTFDTVRRERNAR